MKINFGSGEDYRSGWVNVDPNPNVKADVRHDLEKFPFPFKDNSAEEILCRHVLEHVNPKLVPKVMEEFHRVLKPNGLLVIEAPYGHSHYTFNDPTHYRGFTYNSFTYFTSESPQKYYSKARFKIRKREFRAVGKSAWARFSAWLANLHPGIYERVFSHVFCADAIYFELEKV